MYDAILKSGDAASRAAAPTAAPGRDSSGPSARGVWGIIRRHAVPIVAAGLVTAGVTAYVTSRMAPVYSGAATVRIDTKQRGFAIQDLLGVTTDNQVKTEMEVLRSRLLAGAVIDSLGLQLRLTAPGNVARDDLLANVAVDRDAPSGLCVLHRARDGSFTARAADGGSARRVQVGERVALGGAAMTLLPAARRHANITIAIEPREVVIDSLLAALEVNRRGRDADIIEVAYESTDRQLVRDVPNTLLALFLERRRDVQQTETHGAVAFLREQLDRLAVQLRTAEDSLRIFRERAGVVSLPDQAASAVRRVADLRAQRDAAEVERADLQRLMDQARAEAAQSGGAASSAYRNLAGFPTLLRIQAVAGLLGSLQTAEDRRADLLTRRRPEDSDVQLLTQRMQAIEAQLGATITTYLQGLTDQVATLDGQIAAARRETDRIPAEQIQYARFERQTRILDGVFTTFQSRLKEAELAEAAYDPSVRLLDAATLPTIPVRPKPLLNVLLALIAGLGLGVAGAFAHDLADRSVHTRHDLLAATGVPVLGLIPSVRRAARWRRDGGQAAHDGGALLTGPASSSGRGTKNAAHAALADAYQRLDANLSCARPDAPFRMLVVTSPLPGDGKTTSAVNLAITLAQRGLRVLLVDADLRRGRVAAALGAGGGQGFSEVLRGIVPPEAALRTVTLDGGAQLTVLPAGDAPPYPAQLLASRHTHEVLAALAPGFDTIVLDTPPVNVLADAALLAARSDAVVVVARAGSTPTEALTFAVEQLRIVRAPVLGALLNDIDITREATYDRIYRYYRPAARAWAH